MALHLTKDASQCGLEFSTAGKVSVVSSRSARVLPQPLGGIELRRVGRQLVYFQPVAVGAEPTPNFRIFVIGGVVLDEDGSLPPVGSRQLLQERQVAGSVEHRVLAVMETRTPEFDGAQNLHVLAFASDRDLGRMAHPAPSGMQGRVLAEAGFVGKDQGPVLRVGFFLICG